MNIFRKLLLSALLLSPALVMATDDHVNINTADAAELEKELIGVTEGLANAIVAYREKHGDFRSPEDLELVEGIRYDTVNINRYVIEVN